jgi:hypothetical protein
MHKAAGITAVSIALTSLTAGALGAPAASAPGDAYLDALRGAWVMTGTVMGKAVLYRASGERVLNGAFLCLHMIDAAEPPQYQAEVYLGYDAKADDYIVHWLDAFGAAGARVVGAGHRDGERLIVTFPYAEGAFRDTFTHEPGSGTWTLLLESREADGQWSTFARYALTRR